MTQEYQSLDREGTFKAKPLSWNVYEAKSGAVAVNITFLIIAQWNGNDWDSWAEYASTCPGAFYVVKKDGTVNTVTVKQLSESLGWNGDLKAFLDVPSEIEVQITVRAEDYNGATFYKAGWMNPGNHVPSFGASPEDVVKLNTRFGSLLRAAAAAKG
ncbi:MAG: hypothetical protein V1784_09705 [bacterium]